MTLGISYETFKRLNPSKLNHYAIAHKRNIEEQNYLNYINGIYMQSAIVSVVGNMFKKSSEKPIEYMRKPIEIFSKKEEDEKQKQVELFFAQQSAMCANWKRTHKRKEENK